MITSVGNKKIRDIQKLKENKNIKKLGKYLVEGKHLVEEALEANVVEEVIVSESFEDYNIVDTFDGDLIKVADSIMKSIFRVGERVWVSPQLTGKPDWVEATVTQIDNNPFVGVVINVKTDIGELFFEKEDMFKPLEALELCTL